MRPVRAERKSLGGVYKNPQNSENKKNPQFWNLDPGQGSDSASTFVELNQIRVFELVLKIFRAVPVRFQIRKSEIVRTITFSNTQKSRLDAIRNKDLAFGIGSWMNMNSHWYWDPGPMFLETFYFDFPLLLVSLTFWNERIHISRGNCLNKMSPQLWETPVTTSS